jgi:hypothetical protein
MSIETVCNQALDSIGYLPHIGNIYDGSKAARALLNCWVEVRDALLSSMRPDWSWAETKLTLLKSAPNIVNGFANYTTGWNDTFPALPYLYEYQYPADCVDPDMIMSNPLFLPIWRPRAITFRMNASTRTILTNEPDAILRYIKVVGNPDDWHNDFYEAMVLALAKRLEPQLAPQRAASRRSQQQEQQNANSAS